MYLRNLYNIVRTICDVTVGGGLYGTPQRFDMKAGTETHHNTLKSKKAPEHQRSEKVRKKVNKTIDKENSRWYFYYISTRAARVLTNSKANTSPLH